MDESQLIYKQLLKEKMNILELTNMNVYHVKISISEDDDKSLNCLSAISRHITNGQRAVGKYTNRRYWKQIFVGAIRFESVGENAESPVKTLHYLGFSNEGDMQDSILKNLSLRARLFNNRIVTSVKFLGRFNYENLDRYTDFKITKKPIFLGSLFKKQNHNETI